VKKLIIILIMVMAVLSLNQISYSNSGRKILYIDSYHAEAAWIVGITAGITSVLSTRKDIELKIFHMDTKRKPSEKEKKAAGLKAKQIIEKWQPDIVIASDDNASKYLIVPYYKNTALPFVFCGVNWDASVYGFPCKNVTGMVEVSLVKEFIKHVSPFAPGGKIGFLATDTTSGRQVLAQNKKLLEIQPLNIKLVKTMQEWKAAYIALQQSADMLIIANWTSLPGWNKTGLIDFIYKNTRIPSGTFYSDFAEYSLTSFANDPKEQGEWAAKAALEILAGRSPESIPIVTNKRAKIILNMKLAKKMGIKFPMELINNATFLDQGRF